MRRKKICGAGWSRRWERTFQIALDQLQGDHYNPSQSEGCAESWRLRRRTQSKDCGSVNLLTFQEENNARNSKTERTRKNMAGN